MLALALQAVTAFNLVCTGTLTSGNFLGPQTETRQVAVNIRVDLTRGRWCKGECTETTPLRNVTETTITFVAEGDIMGGHDVSDHWMYVNRENGEYLDRTRIGTAARFYVVMTRGTCERRPFTGLPERRF